MLGSADERQTDARDSRPGAPLLTLPTELSSHHIPTRMAALRWINMLLEKAPTEMNRFIAELLPALLHTLSDEADEVVLMNLEVLSRISLLNDDEFEHWRRLQAISLQRPKPNGCVARERFPHQGASDACVVCDPAASHWLRRAARIERRRGGVQGENACVLRV